jgi:dUTP pyrophosphatase
MEILERSQDVPSVETLRVPATLNVPNEGSIFSTLKFVRLSENAFTPTKGSANAAGFDLYSAYNYIVKARTQNLILTDLQISVPNDSYGRVAPRSGLAVKNFIGVGAGVIDRDYRGNVGVVLFNFGSEDFVVEVGDRIAQLICEKICYPKLLEVSSLDATARGSGGFGSTDVKRRHSLNDTNNINLL